jgi:hypothetical protein
LGLRRDSREPRLHSPQGAFELRHHTEGAGSIAESRAFVLRDSRDHGCNTPSPPGLPRVHAHFFYGNQLKEAVAAAFERYENRLNEIRSGSVSPTVRAASGHPLVYRQQVPGHTIESQIDALIEHAHSDGTPVAAERQFMDDGYRGATLIRPALDRLRDLVCFDAIDRIYVHSPDRLARNYA